MSAVNLGSLKMTNTENNTAVQGDTYMPFSLAMYVDFTEMTDETGAGDFYLGFKIHTTDSSGNPICYFPGMGSNIGGQDWYRTFYVMNQETGEWERVFFSANGYTSGIRFFPSKSIRNNAAGNPISLAGYKGYIAIPMAHFKRGNADGSYLINDAEHLNNIFSVEVCFTGANGTADKFANKSFTIDNIGFTYDPDFYALKGKDLSSRNDPTYAEVFGAKSTKATEFETAVAAIDPYDTATLAAKIEEAKAIYGAPYNDTVGTLSQWQKDNVQTVIQAKALLDKYIAGDIPEAAMTLAELKTAIANLPGIPENAVTANPIPKPGFLSDASKPLEAGAVNYKDFGFDSKKQALDIITYYTDTYRRLSAGDKASLTDAERTKLINAYNAAMRCTSTLETIRTKGLEFSEKLKTVYKTYDDNGTTLRLVKTSEKKDIVQLSVTEYEPLPYYAKTGLSDGSLIPAFAGMTDGIARFFANVITDEAGTITDGGVKVLMDKYTALYAEVKTELDAKRVLTKDLADRLNDAVAEYNDLIPAYKNVFELYFGSEQADASGQYQGIKDILELFPRFDTAFADGGTEATLALNPDNESTASQALNVNYIEEFPVETGGAVTTYFTIEYDGVLDEGGGVISRNYELYLNGNKVDKSTDGNPISVTEEMLGTALKNNTYSAESPLAMNFTAKLIDTEVFTQQLSDTVTIYQYRAADAEKGETDPVLLGTYTLNVNYTPSEGYTVTIPAEVPVDWGTEETDVSYSVDCVLKEGSKLNVTVEGSGTLTAVKDSAFKMNYETAGFAPAEFSGIQTAAKPITSPVVKISSEEWNSTPVGEYRDRLTYTVDYITTP